MFTTAVFKYNLRSAKVETEISSLWRTVCVAHSAAAAETPTVRWSDAESPVHTGSVTLNVNLGGLCEG